MFQVTQTTSQPEEVGLSPLSDSFMTIMQSTVNKQKPFHEETENSDNDNVNEWSVYDSQFNHVHVYCQTNGKQTSPHSVLLFCCLCLL